MGQYGICHLNLSQVPYTMGFLVTSGGVCQWSWGNMRHRDEHLSPLFWDFGLVEEYLTCNFTESLCIIKALRSNIDRVYTNPFPRRFIHMCGASIVMQSSNIGIFGHICDI